MPLECDDFVFRKVNSPWPLSETKPKCRHSVGLYIYKKKTQLPPTADMILLTFASFCIVCVIVYVQKTYNKVYFC